MCGPVGSVGGGARVGVLCWSKAMFVRVFFNGKFVSFLGDDCWVVAGQRGGKDGLGRF